MLKTLQADDDRSADQSQVNVGGSVWKQRHNHNNPVHQWFSNHGTRTILIWFELMFIFNRNLCLPSAIVFQPVTPETRFAPLLYHRHYSAVASLRPVSLCFTFSSLPNPPLKFVLHSSHSLGGPLVSQTHTETNTSMCVCVWTHVCLSVDTLVLSLSLFPSLVLLVSVCCPVSVTWSWMRSMRGTFSPTCCSSLWRTF